MRLADRLRGDLLFESTLARYAFGVAAVAVALALRIWLTPLTGTGAPLGLFFAATLLTCLLAGVGPAVLSVALGLPLAAAFFIVPAGFSVAKVAYQISVAALDGIMIIYLTVLTNRRQRGLQDANRELQSANDERAYALTRGRETIELAPDAYLLADLNGHLVDVNQAACRLLGYERDELVEKTIFDLIPPEDAARLEAVKAELMVPGAVSKAEWHLKRKDGAHVPVELSSNILRDGRWQAFVRESATAQLRESEERFRLTIDNAPIGMSLVALDGRFVRVNQALCQLTGYSADELMKLTFQDITHPDDLDTDVDLANRLARGDIPRYQLEKRYIRKDKSIVDIMLSVSVLRGPDGAARYFISQIEDITARKRAGEALRLSEAKFSGIVSIAADAIISVDENQRIEIFNEGAEQIFGYARSEVIGTPLDRLIPERLRSAHAEHFAGFAAGNEFARAMGERQEVFGLRKNGDEFPAEASISKVGVGSVMFFSVVLRDVTERKKVEEALRRAVAARDGVLGIVAHDLRNPLSTIMMQASLLERPAPEPERRDQTPKHVITRSATRMHHLIQDLLDVAVMEAGKMKIERERLSAADLVRDAVETQAPLASASGLELTLEVGEGVHDVWGDHNRLLQVFDNLIGNAIKFTPEGGRIRVCAAARNQEVLFSVADTGSGIPPESLPHVFESFWQAATRAKRLGAGLGLPVTKGIVEAHGGGIRVESEVGHGSTFFFTIPTAPAEAGG